MSIVSPGLQARFLKKYRVAESGCWDWIASKKPNGYGQIQTGRRGEGLVYAHRVSYELHKGPIPESLVIDHLCRNRGCVNPEHLEAVPFIENVRRGAKCSRSKFFRQAIGPVLMRMEAAHGVD